MILALTSASGSPGVTTTAVGLACTWPTSALCVDADATGGSSVLAGFFRGFQAPEVTVVDLLISQRAGRLGSDMMSACLPLSENSWVLPGPRSHRQVRSVMDLWRPLASQLCSQDDLDTIVDLGRLGMESFAHPLMDRADVLALVVESNLPSVAAARQWADFLTEWKGLHPEAGALGLIIIGPGKPYTAQEMASALGLPVFACLDKDVRSAAVYSHGSQHAAGGRYIRQLTSLGQALRDAGEARVSMEKLAAEANAQTEQRANLVAAVASSTYGLTGSPDDNEVGEESQVIG